MKTIFKYYFIQICNYWRQLKNRIKFEIAILFIIFFTFFTGKLVDLFNQALAQPETTPIGIYAFVIHALLIFIITPAPFIYFKLFPKQRGLMTLALQPLSKWESFGILFIHFLKYVILIILITAPIITALAITCGYFALIYALIMIIASLLCSLLLIQTLVSVKNSRTAVYLIYYLLTIIYFSFFFILYGTKTEFVLLPDLILISVTIYLLYFSWNKHWRVWDIMIIRLRPIISKSTQTLSNLTYFNFPKVLPGSILPYFTKETLTYFRNKSYIRLKVISFFIYILLLALIEILYSENYISLVVILSLIFIWNHYSHQFNERYVHRESAVFIRVQPIGYLSYITAKLISEFLYILIILIAVFLSALIHSVPLYQAVNLLSVIFLFAAFILYTLTVIRLIFYDNPRAAGYAYHFMIIFSLVMIYNFYLVGPIITLFILIYMNIISYRQFAK